MAGEKLQPKYTHIRMAKNLSLAEIVDRVDGDFYLAEGKSYAFLEQGLHDVRLTLETFERDGKKRIELGYIARNNTGDPIDIKKEAVDITDYGAIVYRGCLAFVGPEYPGKKEDKVQILIFSKDSTETIHETDGFRHRALLARRLATKKLPVQ
ncbi:hypothetical protein KKG52_02720 [Patescibacteria group bacterium]|nr:hypothetical protein [Patescibacteria group bacterium]